jgi:uncharacterized protein YidB (DUF937 family)
MAQQSDMSHEETCDCVAQALPQMVNNATPEGEMPSPEGTRCPRASTVSGRCSRSRDLTRSDR